MNDGQHAIVDKKYPHATGKPNTDRSNYKWKLALVGFNDYHFIVFMFSLKAVQIGGVMPVSTNIALAILTVNNSVWP